MRHAFLSLAIMVTLTVTRAATAAPLVFCCNESNDLYQAVKRGGADVARFDTPMQAVEQTAQGGALLVLADEYPRARSAVDQPFFAMVEKKKLRLYVEFPGYLPDVQLGEVHRVTWERVVVAGDGLGLPKLRILGAHDVQPIAVQNVTPLLTLARVAGYDAATYGIPEQNWPLLFEMHEGDWLIATAKLSGFVTGRFAPREQWPALWGKLIHRLTGAKVDSKPVALVFEPAVRPAYGADDPLPQEVEAMTLSRAAQWYRQSRLLVHPSQKDRIYALARAGTETMDMLGAGDPIGDGSLGILEGYASRINPDGSQPVRSVLRADCQTESAMVLAMDPASDSSHRSRTVAQNLLDYTYFTSGMCGGRRGDPHHPAFGLIAWGDLAPAWEVANYGDDNARAILATLAAAASLRSDRWDQPVLRALLANLRTTGAKGFRGDRIDIPALEKQGWKHFHDAQTVNTSPHFESYLWACYLWAYARTREKEFLDKSESGLRLTMAVYPDGWHWNDSMERAKILLPLAWLVRVDDTPEHRQWLKRIATDLLEQQAPCGVIRDHISGTGGGHHMIAQSNEAYGTSETPLIQTNDDASSDQLYTTGFALLGLHEAAAATNVPELRAAEDKLAQFLCRIQIRSETHPWLDGAWFRAFDFAKWDYWASSGDLGWGAWCVEAGWGQSWTAATLALRQRKTTLWDLTAESTIATRPPKVREEMSANDGGPWK